MTLEGQFANRQKVFDDALATVEAAALDGGVIELHAEAQRLLKRHQDCMMPVGEVEAEIVRLASQHGVAVIFD